MSGKAGIERVIAEADAPSIDAPAEQLDMLGAAKAEAQPAAAPAPAEGGGIGKGRPPGARNRRTDEMVRFLNTFGQGPLVGLAKIVNAIRFYGPEAGPLAGLPDLRPLAIALGMDVKDAAVFWRNCAGDLAPYMHQKLPIAVDVTGESAGSLVVVNLGAVQGDPETDLGGLLGGHLGDVIDGEVADDSSEENQ